MRRIYIYIYISNLISNTLIVFHLHILAYIHYISFIIIYCIGVDARYGRPYLSFLIYFFFIFLLLFFWKFGPSPALIHFPRKTSSSSSILHLFLSIFAAIGEEQSLGKAQVKFLYFIILILNLISL